MAQYDPKTVDPATALPFPAEDAPQDEIPAPRGVDPNADAMAALAAVGGGAPGMTPSTGGPPGQVGTLAPSPQAGAASALDAFQGATGVNLPQGGGPLSNPVLRVRQGVPQNPYENPMQTMPDRSGMQPQNPYEKPMTPMGQKLSPVQQAARDEDTALAESAQAHSDALKSQNAATAAHANALADVQERHAQAIAANDRQFQAAREALHKQSAAETAAWMHQLDTTVAKEPNPGRWWEHQGGFSKVMWLMSLAFGTMAAAKSPGTKNVALEMISREVDEDIARQKDRLARELDTAKLKGTMMQKDQAQKLADLTDDHTAKAARLAVLERALETRTTAPGSADDAAAQAAGLDWVKKEKLGVAKDRYDKAVSMGEAELARKNQIAVAGIHAQSARDVAIIHETGENSRAMITAGARLLGQQKGPKPDFQDIPQQAGVKVRTADGKVANLSVHKDQVKEVTQLIQNTNATGNALADLREAIQNSDLSDKILNNDNARRAALKKLADPIIKQMGGRFNKDTVNEAQQYFLGENPDSLLQRLKGGSKEEIVALLDKELADLPGTATKKLQAFPSNLSDDPNARIELNLERTSAPRTPNQTQEDRLAAAGVPQQGPAHPQTEGEYLKAAERERSVKGTGLPDLGKSYPDLGTRVTDALRDFGSLPGAHGRPSPGNVKALKGAAEDEILDWREKHRGDQAAVDAANDALVRVQAEAHKARDAAQEKYDAVKEQAYNFAHPRLGSDHEIDPAKVKEIAERKGVDLTAKEIGELVDYVNRDIGR